MQGKYWRFDINNQNQSSTGSTSSSTTGQSGQSNHAFLIIESNDQQTAVQQAKQLLGSQQSQTLGVPTQVDESTAKQFSSTRSTQTV
jgi:hypothetical protein